MSDYFDRVESQIVQRVEEGLPGSVRRRPALGHLATAAAVLVVIVVAGVFLLARGAGSSHPASPATGGQGVSVTFAPHGPFAGGNPARTIAILRARLHQAVPDAHVSLVGGRVMVRVSKGGAATRAQILALAAVGRLVFYDWEADAVSPNGKTVASQLAAQTPGAVQISQGSGTAATGEDGAGGKSLGQALALASKLGSHQLRHVEHIGRTTFSLPAGYVVVQAAGQGPGAQFFLLRNLPRLTGRALRNERPGTDPGGSPAVTFGFTGAGAHAFQALTATLARRGARVSGLGETFNQHFAIALDNRLIEVPYVDFKQYPDGISADSGAEITGGITAQEAKDIAILLRYGPLPVDLTAAAG